MEKTSTRNLTQVATIVLIIIGIFIAAVNAYRLLQVAPSEGSVGDLKFTIYSHLGLSHPTLDKVETLGVPALYLCLGILYLVLRKRGIAIIIVGLIHSATLAANTIYVRSEIPELGYNPIASFIIPIITIVCGCILCLERRHTT